MVRLDFDNLADRYMTDELKAIADSLKTLSNLQLIEHINECNARLAVKSFGNLDNEALLAQIKEVQSTKVILESLMALLPLIEGSIADA